jgi:uncharacterized protein YbaA (DUF1428 family)
LRDDYSAFTSIVTIFVGAIAEEGYWIVDLPSSVKTNCRNAKQGTTREEGPISYVDGYVLPVPAKNLQAYRRIAQKAGKIWREHGALEYRECVGDDLDVKGLVPLPRRIKLKPGETVVFAWIVFKSRAHRDRVNAKVMKDPRLSDMMDPKSRPFDRKRMVYDGFKVLVDA